MICDQNKCTETARHTLHKTIPRDGPPGRTIQLTRHVCDLHHWWLAAHPNGWHS